MDIRKHLEQYGHYKRRIAYLTYREGELKQMIRTPPSAADYLHGSVSVVEMSRSGGAGDSVGNAAASMADMIEPEYMQLARRELVSVIAEREHLQRLLYMIDDLLRTLPPFDRDLVKNRLIDKMTFEQIMRRNEKYFDGRERCIDSYKNRINAAIKQLTQAIAG